MQDLEDIVLAFDRACREARVDYAFVGGIAVLAWGQPRTTMDVDALVRLRAPDIQRLVVAAVANGLQVSPENLSRAIEDETQVIALDQGNSLRVVLMVARTAEELAEVQNAVEIPFGGGSLRIVRAEDTVAFKLTLGSDRDTADARSILARRAGKLDSAYLDRLCLKLGVAPALRKLQEQVSRGLGGR